MINEFKPNKACSPTFSTKLVVANIGTIYPRRYASFDRKTHFFDFRFKKTGVIRYTITQKRSN